jgi:hypothetical protein
LPEFWKFEVGEVITTKLMFGVTSAQQLIRGRTLTIGAGSLNSGLT